MMFGKNAVAKARKPEEGFLVHSIFYTIQGEGPFAGYPAIFVRLSGCNLRCFWCDTDFESIKVEYSPEDLADAIRELSEKHRCPLVVITGGEPMLQPLHLLFALFAFTQPLPGGSADQCWWFQIETAGTSWPEGMLSLPHDPQVEIVVSPKTPKLHPKILECAEHWKYIIRSGQTHALDGLPSTSTQIEGEEAFLCRPPDHVYVSNIFVQACDELGIHKGRANLEAAARIAMEHGYRLSIQMHKIAGLE